MTKNGTIAVTLTIIFLINLFMMFFFLVLGLKMVISSEICFYVILINGISITIIIIISPFLRLNKNINRSNVREDISFGCFKKIWVYINSNGSVREIKKIDDEKTERENK